MSQRNRLGNGGRIDRKRPLRFTFNGVSYQGFAGDTLASALLANGVDVLNRSFKYARPRGLVTAGADEPNAIAGVVPTGVVMPKRRAMAATVPLYGLVLLARRRKDKGLLREA